MRTRSKTLMAVLMASAVGVTAAAPGFATTDDAAPEVQLAHGYGYGPAYGPGHARDRDDRRGGWERGRGGPRDDGARSYRQAPRGPGGPGMGMWPGSPGFRMGPGAPAFGMGPGGGLSEALIERFDLDGDGTITREELDTANAERLRAYDTDGDGALSLEEFKVLWMDTMNLRIVRDFQALDPDGDAKVSLEEYSRRYERMFDRLDRNGDGILDDSEIAGRGPGMGPGGPGPRGPGGPGMGPGGSGGPGMGPGMGPGRPGMAPGGPGPDGGPEPQGDD